MRKNRWSRCFSIHSLARAKVRVDPALRFRVAGLVRADELHRPLLLEVLVEPQVETQGFWRRTRPRSPPPWCSQPGGSTHDGRAELVVGGGRTVHPACRENRPDGGQGPGSGGHGVLEERTVAGELGQSWGGGPLVAVAGEAVGTHGVEEEEDSALRPPAGRGSAAPGSDAHPAASPATRSSARQGLRGRHRRTQDGMIRSAVEARTFPLIAGRRI